MMENVLIIAEAGVNHNGNIENAYKLIDVAVEAGVDYVKFQTFKTELCISKNAKKASYQIQNSLDKKESQFEMVKKMELSHEQHKLLISYCKQKGIKFFSTAFDLISLEYLANIGFELVKIPSGEITNLPYLIKAASLFKKVIISTGMASMTEVKEALDVFLNAGVSKDNITILHCNTEYPTPMKDVNLKAMLSISDELKTKIGYSDHTLGIEIPIAAVALGATVIEKHFTLDKKMDGPDHKASLEPNELISMVKAIRNIELAMSGNGIKVPSESELKNISIARKSIVAVKNIAKGEILSENNITTKRPGNGLSPMKWNDVLGTISKRAFFEDEPIEI